MVVTDSGNKHQWEKRTSTVTSLADSLNQAIRFNIPAMGQTDIVCLLM